MSENRLTEGNVYRVLLRFSVPFLIANCIQALYGAVDLAIIGWTGHAAAVAAVSTGTQVTQIITSLVSGLTLGSTILVGRFIGANREDLASKAIGTTLSVFMLVAMGLTVVMLVSVNGILTLLQTPQESFNYARQYVVVCSLGIFFICGYNAISAILRGYGDSKRPMIFVGLACILNVALDLLFVCVFDWGVQGVAAATVLSQALSMVCCIYSMKKNRFIFDFKWRSFKIDSGLCKELGKIGIPISLQECMVRLSFLYLTSITNSLGVAAAAAVGIASKYDVFAMLPATSMSSALAAITAQNCGANRLDRVHQSLKVGLAFALCCSCLFFLWAQISPASMIGMFSQDSVIIQTGIPFFKTCSFDYLAVAFVFCLNGVLNGREKTTFTMISYCFGAIAMRMPLIYLAARYFPDNLAAIGMIAPTVSGVMAIYTLIYVLYLFRQDKKRIVK